MGDMAAPSADTFDHLAADYDAWYDRHALEFAAELDAVRPLLDGVDGAGLEIGVGTGRFAATLGIGFGLDPAPRMAAYARDRGIRTVIGEAERLPFRDGVFGYTAFITSLCFVADPLRALREAHRVTGSGGSIVVAYLEPESAAGRRLLAEKADSPYYSRATLLPGREVERLLRAAGYLPQDAAHLEPVAGEPTGPGQRPARLVPRPGRDGGLFCVIGARRLTPAPDDGTMTA